MTELKYKYYADVKAADVDWLWYPYIPYGKITLLQGDPGEGKSTLILNIAALLTCGKEMPDGYPNKEPQTVIYQCSEDGVADTVKPRLVNAGADCSRVAFIDEDEKSVTFDDNRIEAVIKQTGARLLILDPIQSFIPQDADMQNAGKMRAILGRLGNVAKKYNCAVVLVGHMNKSQGNKSLYRGLGSIDIPAIARSVLMIERDEQSPSIRYMRQIKSSLAAEGKEIGFSLGCGSGFHWILGEELELITESIGKPSKSERAQTMLMGMLGTGRKKAREIYAYADCLGISERTVNSVKKEMGILSERIDKVWYWRLPDEDRKE